MRKETKVTVRLHSGQYRDFRAASKREGFSSVSEWIRVTMQNRINKKAGRPVLSSEQREQNKLERDFREEEALAFASDSGVLCSGSGELWIEDKSLSGFKFPSGLCEVCHRNQFGLREGDRVRVRKHTDGTQTDEEILRML